MASFNPGDVLITTFEMVSPRGYLDLSRMFLSSNIYESIYSPGIVGYFDLLDSEDILGEYKVSGDEEITFVFLPPGGLVRKYIFKLNSVNDVSQEGAMKSKIYRLTCLSTEALQARANHVTKSYNTQISNVIQDIFKTYLKSDKPINIEPTKGIQKFLTNNKKPFSVIKELTSRAISMNNKSSLFLFFENSDGYNFTSMQKLFESDVLKYLKRVDTTGTSWEPQADNNIIAYKLYRQGSALDRVGLGSLNTQTQTFDLRTRKFETKKSQPNESDYGILGAISSSFFKNLFGKTPGQSIFVQKDSMKPETYLDQNSGDKKSYLAAMMQNQLDVEVYGDTVFKAGGTVFCDIPKISATTGLVKPEPIIYGKFMITKMAHNISRPSTRPRYTNSLELIKAGFENGVS